MATDRHEQGRALHGDQFRCGAAPMSRPAQLMWAVVPAKNCMIPPVVVAAGAGDKEADYSISRLKSCLCRFEQKLVGAPVCMPPAHLLVSLYTVVALKPE